MYLEQDDFFYYLKVAQNLAAGRGSTFNGLVPTNGYHPLWMLTLATVLRLGANSKAILFFLGASIFMATMTSFALSVRLLRRGGVAWALSVLGAALVAVYCTYLYVECMEVTLAIPLMLAVLVAVQADDWWSEIGVPGFRRACLIGVLVAMMVLSRLDTALFAILLALGIAAQPTLRQRLGMAHLAGLAVELLPILVYLLINKIDFGVWMPVSGMAKQLKLSHGFTASAPSALSAVRGWDSVQWFHIGLICVALLLLPLLRNRLTPVERVIAVSTLTFPFLYLAVLCWLSDWRLWGWYFYSLRPALCVGVLLLFRFPLVQSTAQRPTVFAALALLTLYRIHGLEWYVQSPTMVDAAIEVQHFAATHPGVYAMGDRAGTVGYLLPAPLVQTEGLVMDAQFLKLVAAQTPLLQALARYKTTYHVGIARVPFTGCFQASEPWQAGGQAPHMRATICEPPLARWRHGDAETLIFGLSHR